MMISLWKNGIAKLKNGNFITLNNICQTSQKLFIDDSIIERYTDSISLSAYKLDALDAEAIGTMREDFMNSRFLGPIVKAVSFLSFNENVRLVYFYSFFIVAALLLKFARNNTAGEFYNVVGFIVLSFKIFFNYAIAAALSEMHLNLEQKAIYGPPLQNRIAHYYPPAILGVDLLMALFIIGLAIWKSTSGWKRISRSIFILLYFVPVVIFILIFLFHLNIAAGLVSDTVLLDGLFELAFGQIFGSFWLLAIYLVAAIFNFTTLLNKKTGKIGPIIKYEERRIEELDDVFYDILNSCDELSSTKVSSVADDNFIHDDISDNSVDLDSGFVSNSTNNKPLSLIGKSVVVDNEIVDGITNTEAQALLKELLDCNEAVEDVIEVGGDFDGNEDWINIG